MTIIISRVINLFFHLCVWHWVPRDYILGKFPWRRRCDSDINSWLVVSAERHEYWGRKESGRCYCQTVHHGTWPYIAFIKFRLIWSATVFWSTIELLSGKLYNQGRCDRHARQLYGPVAGNSGDFFPPLVFANLWFFVPNFIFLRKWPQWQSVTRTL